MEIQAEEQTCLAEHIRQIENKRFLEYQQTRPDPTILNGHTDDQRPKDIIMKRGLKIPIQNLQDSSRDKYI